MRILDLVEAYAKTPVKSSHIVDIEHNGKNLFVSFNNGSRYEYFDVPEKVAYALNKAPSKGRNMWASIRSQYKYRKMNHGEAPTQNIQKGVPVNHHIQAPNGDTYIWRGRAWVNTKNKRIARKEIAQGLTRYAIASINGTQPDSGQKIDNI